jgi:hypothetical protein
VLAQEDWEVVRFPAIAEEDESWAFDAELGQSSFTRRRGEALHRERQPLETIERIRRTIGEYNFTGQYQQAPSPQGGGMVKAAWFRSFAVNELPEKFDRVVQSWDTATKASELSDFSVYTSWGVKGKNVYLLHVLRKRMEYPELKRAVRDQAQAFPMARERSRLSSSSGMASGSSLASSRRVARLPSACANTSLSPRSRAESIS